MESEKFEKYNAKRKEILIKYKKQKFKSVFLTLSLGAVAIALTWILHMVSFINVAVALVLTAVFVMMSVIFARMRAVTVNHVRDKELQLFEDNDPTFY